MTRPLLTLLCLSASLLGTLAPVHAGPPISLDVRDLDIYDTVRLLSTQADVNVVLDAAVPHHAVTLTLRNVSFDQALATLAQSNDLETVRVGNIVFLGPGDSINRRYPIGRGRSAHTIVLPLRNAVPGPRASSSVDRPLRSSAREPSCARSTVPRRRRVRRSGCVT